MSRTCPLQAVLGKVLHCGVRPVGGHALLLLTMNIVFRKSFFKVVKTSVSGLRYT